MTFPAKLMLKPDAIHLGGVRGMKSASVELHNLTKRPVTVGDASCSVASVEVSMPDGKRIAPGEHVGIAIEMPEASPLAVPYAARSASRRTSQSTPRLRSPWTERRWSSP